MALHHDKRELAEGLLAGQESTAPLAASEWSCCTTDYEETPRGVPRSEELSTADLLPSQTRPSTCQSESRREVSCISALASQSSQSTNRGRTVATASGRAAHKAGSAST